MSDIFPLLLIESSKWGVDNFTNSFKFPTVFWNWNWKLNFKMIIHSTIYWNWMNYHSIAIILIDCWNYEDETNEDTMKYSLTPFYHKSELKVL